MSKPRPFAEAVGAYALAGWPCILPVPPAKSPPPVGFTGAAGRDTTPDDLAGWFHSHAESSIALRMPDGVIGIDVDEYVKGTVTKHGAATLAELAGRLGELPATWTSTARGEGPSRIHFYRVPPGRYVTKFPDVEIVQRHHRYAVVWPSPHADAGDIYRWYGPDGVECWPPKPEELPELPQVWVDALREGATEAGPSMAPYAGGEAMLTELRRDDRVACAEVTSAAMAALGELNEAELGSRHDVMTGRVHQLVQLGAHGHPGAGIALDSLAQLWAQLTAGEDREGEWERMALTSARKAVTALAQLTPVAIDPCLVIGATYAPAPHPDASDPEPLAAARQWHVYDYIGAHAFDPRFGLDQPLAEAVLERMYPALRYAFDSKGWLRRGPDAWEHLGELADWAVSTVADRMPIGDAAAEKGTEAFDQAARRRRFMSAAPSGAIAKKVRALVLAGGHPCSVKAAELDSEAWLLWAGGVAWDLSASSDSLVVASVDPGTPHLRAAAVTPEPRPTPLWDAFTAAVWPDAELRAWALRVMAVCFTGQSDAVLPLLLGEPGRGKTQIVDLLMSVLGSYAHAASNKLLDSNARAHDSIITALKGRRLSFIDEAPHDRQANQERLKQLTGGSELTGNQMNQNPITFPPTHTLVLTANHEPNLTDAALRRRLRLIPCEGDPAEVKAARYAIGQKRGAAWRREAPGVLAKMIREAGRYLADESSAANDAAPTAYRYRAEHIAAEQNLEAGWVEDACEPANPGDRAHSLYVAFVAWCRSANVPPAQIPNHTKWGRNLTQLGYPSTRDRLGKFRPLKLRSMGGWPAGPGIAPIGDQLALGSDQSVTGSPENWSHENSPELPNKSESVTSVTSLQPAVEIARAHTHTHEAPMTNELVTGHTGHGGQSEAIFEAESTKITKRLLADPSPVTQSEPAVEPATAKRTRLTDAEKARRAADRVQAKAAAKGAELAERIADAAGPLLALPALVLPDGSVLPLDLDQLAEAALAFGWRTALTVDVEHTGYPIGHADYALRTVQLGNRLASAVLDADDPAHMAFAAALLRDAERLHAHSSQADLVPLAVAGLIDFEDASARMLDTVIPAKLLDPASTGSDPDLKGLSANVLGEAATSPDAEAAKNALFKAGKWLTKLKPTTPIERSGWAQSDRRCTTMVRYGGSDVLDGAALAERFYAPGVLPAELLERERTAQRMTSRVTYRGLAIDAARVDNLRHRETAALADAAARLGDCGVTNPGSDAEIAATALGMGATLPRTPTGRPSVARGALDPYRKLDNRLGEFVRARLDYQKSETALGLFLEPYHDLVARGDGRARPTIYTLSADTGRMSCVRPNLQQVPREGGYRSCITADPGYALISADFASVEIRVAAALSGDATLRALLDAGLDVHSEVARQVYGPDFTKADRYDTKRGVFGWLYGAGLAKIAATLGISQSIAAAIVDSLKEMAPELVRWTFGVRQAVERGQAKFEAYSGRTIHLPAASAHAGPNYAIQGSARELLVDALIRWEATPWGTATLLPVHDEIVVAVPADEAQEASSALVTAMETTLYGVQIAAERSEPSFAWQDAS